MRISECGFRISRREFLKSGGAALASASLWVRPALAKDHPVLIAIFQRGAVDGISMVVPFGDKNYRLSRPRIAISDAIDLDGFFGLHPALDSLKSIYDQGHLAIVHAVGSPNSTRSHFDAQDYMESGTPGKKATDDGWLNRYMQATGGAVAGPFRGVAINATMPRSMMGAAPTLAMQRAADFGIRGGLMTAEIEELFADYYRETFEAVRRLRGANPQQYAAAGVEYPDSPFGRALLEIAQLIKADVGLEVAFADIGGWDTHANQGSSRGQLANRLQDFGGAISAFYRDLGDRMRNVVILTMTEFGRTIHQNGSGGTDHGHGSCLFVSGGPVKGGKVYGRWPGLDPDQLFEGRDLAVTTDFRDVFSEVLVRHMGARNLARVFPDFTAGPLLGLL